MSGDPLFVFILIGVAGALFASGRVRLDIVALLVVLTLLLGGVLTTREALSGFGDPVVILVAGLLVVGESLSRTGIAHSLGVWMARVGGTSEARMIGLLMVTAAFLSSLPGNAPEATGAAGPRVLGSWTPGVGRSKSRGAGPGADPPSSSRWWEEPASLTPRPASSTCAPPSHAPRPPRRATLGRARTHGR